MITDLCILKRVEDSRELIVTSIHPGVDRERLRQNTGWDLRFAAGVAETAPPTVGDLEVLRDLYRRADEAHGGG